MRQRAFVWDRPLRPAERSALGDNAPTESEPVLGVQVADEGVKAAVIADDPDVFFTTPHFDGYAAVLVRLDRIPLPELAELVEDAWRLRAPKRLLAELDRPCCGQAPAGARGGGGEVASKIVARRRARVGRLSAPTLGPGPTAADRAPA